jgi:hypothetical protein
MRITMQMCSLESPTPPAPLPETGRGEPDQEGTSRDVYNNGGVSPKAICLRRSAANLLACLTLLLGPNGSTTAAADVQYNRDVRPVLSEHCFRCHGPDAAARQADMRLDDRDDVIDDRGGYRVVEPGQPNASELFERITAADIDDRMPPADSGSELRSDQIEILRQWIEEGAEYQPHWSFTTPRRLPIPKVRNSRWPKNAIDRFVLARLDREGLKPSPVAERATLIRRVSLDLTGLPPTPTEVDAFERDSSRNPAAVYTRLVDRLLASPQYGERMALSWLDAARYADTNGYFTDLDRTMWPWRDWVIDALNKNTPFDQFTIEQLAGDLLPQATLANRIATGFNRNHMINNETGIIEEEFRVEYVVDRVDTTATIWMGLTVGCARCHDHKYDPISQRDFYRFFSLFNNVPEKGLSGSRGNSTPILSVPSRSQQMQIDRLRREIGEAEQAAVAINEQLDAAQSIWESTVAERLPRPELAGLVGRYPLDDSTAGIVGKVDFVAGMIDRAARFQADACIEIDNVIDFDRAAPFSIAAWIKPKGAGCVISKIDDASQMRGFDVTLRKGTVVVNLVHRWNRDAIQVSAGSVVNNQWQHLTVTYDGSETAAGVSIYLDGKPQPTHVALDSLRGTIRSDQPLRIGRRQASASYSGQIDDVRLYDQRLSDEQVDRLATSQLLRGVVARPVAERSKALKQKLRAWFLKHRADPEMAAAIERLEQLRQTERQLAARVPTTMVMQESAKSRQTFVLARGQYDQPGEKVAAGVPSFLSTDPIANRLDLARWLVSPSHPLTARVTVNRIWQQMFGIGIVKSVDDFGTQGDWPSHPALLDWLSVELVDSGWDLKHLVRLIVTSATYMQSSAYPTSLADLDRDNRLLARGPRFRMEAEMLRDHALSVSGLLSLDQGGPAVMPYQPAGLWLDVTYDSNRAYRPDHGRSLYRRSLYTFWKRQSPPPGMLVFDAPTRETCTVQRSRTNTPLQALALMNDPTFIEASRKLAERLMIEAGGGVTQTLPTARAAGVEGGVHQPSRPDASAYGSRKNTDSSAQAEDGDADRVELAFRLATARRPTADEADILLAAFRRQQAVYRENTSDAQMLLDVGESKYEASLDTADLAAWAIVASMVLCLDETITRP